MLLIPEFLYCIKTSVKYSLVAPTQVKCATVGIAVREVISVVTLTVLSRDEPPAPYVTDTKSGFRG